MTKRQDNLAVLIANVLVRTPPVCAAEVLGPPRPGTQRYRILIRLWEGPATDNELADALGFNPSSVRPRRVALVEAGLVEAAGRRDRSTLWRLTVKGEAVVRP